jgi:endonuclease III
MSENFYPRYAYDEGMLATVQAWPVHLRAKWRDGSPLGSILTEAIVEYGWGGRPGSFMGTSKQREGNLGNDRCVAPITRLPARRRRRIVQKVCEALQARYGNPRHGNPRNPLDDLIYITLSNKTSPATAKRVYRELKQQFPRWGDVLRSRLSTLERILRPAGLSRVKSSQIRAALGQIESDFGSCSLGRLKTLPTGEAEAYLTQLSGVSDKVAKCVLMYACGAQVLPVDSHVHRVAKRLGWTVRKRADQCHTELEALVPAHWRYAFHVNCIAHGRATCRPAQPDCAHCCISRYCFYYRGKL